MIKITGENILVADIPRSDAVVSCQFKGGKDSCTCSYYAGDDNQSKERVKQFMADCAVMYIDINSVHNTIKQLDIVLNSYIYLFKGTIADYKKAKDFFAGLNKDIKIDKFYTTGERGYYTFNNKEAAICAFKGLLYTRITQFEIRKENTTYYLSIKMSENWRKEIMNVKMLKDDLVATFNGFMDSAISSGKDAKTAVVVFAVKYNDIIKNSKVPEKELIAASKYNNPDYVSLIEFGMTLSPDIIWEMQPAEKSFDKDIEILDKNVYGLHITRRNNALDVNDPHVCIGWSTMGDLTAISDKDDLKSLHEASYPTKSTHSRGQDVGQIWTFKCKMSIGDYVVYGDGSVAHIGKITSDYYYDETNGDQDPDYVNNRKVEWLKHVNYRDLPIGLHNSLYSPRSIFSLNEYKSVILDLLNNKDVMDLEDDKDEKTVEEYNKDDFLKDVFMTSEEYDSLYNLLKYKKNIILQGAPGVGKTYLAKRFAHSIIGNTDDNYIEIIQFHQNYSYEDFIMGYKPDKSGFDLKEGVFYNFCKKAEDDPDNDYFFIIDEINRGNLSKIFGELMMLIEGDKRGDEIKLAYRDELFSVPENVYLIGMMNTADRSLAMMDYALRRRFSFFDVEPAFGKLAFKEHLKTYIADSTVVDKVINRLTELNAKIADENYSGLGKGFCIGHSYFCSKPVEGQSDEDWYKTIIQYEIAPLLDEYWWDDKTKADECKKELLKD